MATAKEMDDPFDRERIDKEINKVLAGKLTQAEAARRLGVSRQVMNYHYYRVRAERARAERMAQEKKEAAKAKAAKPAKIEAMAARAEAKEAAKTRAAARARARALTKRLKAQKVVRR